MEIWSKKLIYVNQLISRENKVINFVEAVLKVINNIVGGYNFLLKTKLNILQMKKKVAEVCI